ncbi:MAG: P-loop containing nucleoside triphosphate hydrolase protein [Olpidium bornovanus]|uniref:RNA helicase n=1 Tax=Olpidium bornovanus TaxID=278681 RepID=A0A8H8DJX5_9FUNG|nr:MAG: P-loop containing nucleoside triphosphate hydrolase protein [Olpidium bornovanus]
MEAIVHEVHWLMWRSVSVRPTVPDFDVSSWDEFKFSPKILRAIKRLKFGSPTAIQRAALPPSLAGRDVVGAAATGSGKTFAFGIPMIQHMVSLSGQLERSSDLGATGLVLAPTRELAMQVQNHLRALAKDVEGAKIAAIVGGMSVQKQHRILRNEPDIIVATPGRLWELCSEVSRPGDVTEAPRTFLTERSWRFFFRAQNEEYLAHIRKIRFLVIDEADRMLEGGHFRELTYLLDMLSRKRCECLVLLTALFTSVGAEDKSTRQTFVFSATLTRGLEFGSKDKKNKKGVRAAKGSTEVNDEVDLAEATMSTSYFSKIWPADESCAF